jgi:hypothetical protein
MKFASAFLGFARLGEHRGLLQGFLRLLERFGGVLHGALRLLVSGEMVLLTMSGRRGAVRVRGQLVHLGSSDVIIPGHECLRSERITVTSCGTGVHGERPLENFLFACRFSSHGQINHHSE